MRIVTWLLVAATCLGCTAGLRERTKQNRRERAAKNAPPWVAQAKRNKDLGDAAYAQLVADSAKRAPGEPLTVFYSLDAEQVAAAFLAEAPPGTRREYLRDVFIKSLGTSLGMLESGFDTGLKKTAVPGMRIFTHGSGGICSRGVTWYETMRDCRVAADVFLSIQLELRQQPNCPDGRGFHASARWTSAYQRQEFAFELDFCRNGEEGATTLGAALVPKIDVDLRALLPAIAALELLIPGYRYDWWLYEVDHKGGGGSFGGFD